MEAIIFMVFICTLVGYLTLSFGPAKECYFCGSREVVLRKFGKGICRECINDEEEL